MGVPHDWMLAFSMSFVFRISNGIHPNKWDHQLWYISFDLSVEGFIGGWAFDNQILQYWNLTN